MRPFLPVDAAEWEASNEQRVPPLTRIADDTWMLGLETRSRIVPYSLAYLVRDGDGGVHVIDAGTASEANWAALSGAVAHVAGSLGAVRTVIATHLHPDHLGLADRLREATGAQLVLHRAEQEILSLPPTTFGEERLDAWGVPADCRDELRGVADSRGLDGALRADILVEGGELLAVPGRRLRVMATPGHTRGHLCVRDEERSLLFVGDHLLPTVNPGIGLGWLGPTNPLEDYLLSLERTAAFDLDVACPGHGYRFTGIRSRSHDIARHHLRRNHEITALSGARPRASVWEIAAAATWSAGWAAMHGGLLASALRQTEMHMALGRVS